MCAVSHENSLNNSFENLFKNGRNRKLPANVMIDMPNYETILGGMTSGNVQDIDGVMHVAGYASL